MYSKVLIVTSTILAAVAHAVQTVVSSVSIVDSNRDSSQLPPQIITISPAVDLAAGYVSTQSSPDKEDDSRTNMYEAIAQIPITASIPRVTALGHYLDEDPALRYLPKPGPMPTTAPDYPKDMAAHLNSIMSANQASILGMTIEGLDTHEGSKILSAESAMSSASNGRLSASRASLTEERNYSSASKAIGEIMKPHSKSGAASSSNTMDLVTLFAVFVGFASLAYLF